MDGYLSTNDVLERIDINYDHLRRRLREDPTLGEKDENGRLWIREDRLEDLRRYARLSEAEQREIVRLEEDGLVAKQIARRINTDRRKRGGQKKVSERTVQAFLRKQRSASTEPPHIDESGIPSPLKKALETLAPYLYDLRVSGQISEEEQRNTYAYYKQRLLEYWRIGPYTQLNEEEYERIDPAEIDAYVAEMAEKITSDLDILYEARNTPPRIEESSAAATRIR